MLVENATPDRRREQLRAEQRMRVRLIAQLESARGRCTCHVHDISRGGACLDAALRPVIGEQVRLRRGALDAEAKVVWIVRGRFGIQFAKPIRATELLVQMNQSRRAAELPQGTPRAAKAPISPSS